MESGVIDTKKGISDQHKRHTDTCVHSSTTPLFTGKRRHSAAVNSHSSALIKCSGTAFRHRKAFSLDTTPLLPNYSLASYDSSAVTPVRDRQDSATIPTHSSKDGITAASPATIPSNTECNSHYAMATRSSMPPPVSERHDSVNHQTIEISRRVPDKSIRVDRDYSRGDGITRFSTDYPPLLAGRITPEQFQHTIDGINQLLEDAERVSWNAVFDNVMECITIYTWPILFSTHYQRCIRRLLDFIQRENEILYHQHGVSISNPVRCAYLFLELKVYD